MSWHNISGGDLAVVLVVAIGCGTCTANHIASGCERTETYRACVERHEPEQCEPAAKEKP